MSGDEGPVQLDANVTYEEKAPVKQKKRTRLLITACTGLLLAVILLLYQPDSAGFIESPPPAEQAERDSIASLAMAINSFSAQNDSLPGTEDINLPAGYIYLIEEEGLWSLESPGGLYYTSDMDMNEFQEGVL